MIRVNGTTYRWMGNDPAGIAANVTNIQITPTRSIFVIQAGPMNITVTFLSPIEPDDWVKQSIPFSYVSVEAQSLDYPVQVYSDITAEWASGDRSSLVCWSNKNTSKSVYHKIELQNPQPDRAVALDQKITSAAAKISSQYSDVVSLATRQTMGALDITVGTDSSGNLIPSDIKIFMKNFGSDHRVNPVEHIYGAFPAFLYLNASIGGALLDPLLASQDGLTDGTFAAQKVGDAYPAVPGPDAVPQQGVEQSGNMLIMQLAHARISGDGTLLSQYYNLAKRWADYLVSNALKSENQLVRTNQDEDTAVAAAGLANLALKGIIGVKAMAEIAYALGEDLDANQYGNQASTLLSSWLSLATSSGGSRLLGSYGDQQSWSLMYNLFADKMLGLNFVDQSVIDMQTQYLGGLLATAPQWGLAIDSTAEPFGNAAWTLFVSAFVSDTTVRDNMIMAVYNHANFNQSLGLFPERYNVSNNAARNGWFGWGVLLSPALGGTFCHLALTVPNKTIFVASTGGSGGKPNGRSGSGSNTGAVVGGAIGGLASIGIAVAIIFVILRKRRRQQQYEKAGRAEVVEQAPHRPTLAPYGSHHAGNGSDYDVPVNSHSDTTAGSAGIGTGGMGAHQGPSTYDPDARTRTRAPPCRRCRRQRRARGHGTGRPNTRRRSPRRLMSSRDPLSPTDVLGLRAEAENLRRVMQEIRAERLEPPPDTSIAQFPNPDAGIEDCRLAIIILCVGAGDGPAYMYGRAMHWP
ncbi:hypothetical protein LXA43DRAFT_1065747 [Ganoderma leucocontextum]|nr:hypothetical protein LXA43DRAFT_1065747 [Ganoderma leucocontextum]